MARAIFARGRRANLPDDQHTRPPAGFPYLPPSAVGTALAVRTNPPAY
jgi:hypothetical protein